jgi:hypothetical protein
VDRSQLKKVSLFRGECEHDVTWPKILSLLGINPFRLRSPCDILIVLIFRESEWTYTKGKQRERERERKRERKGRERILA